MSEHEHEDLPALVRALGLSGPLEPLPGGLLTEVFAVGTPGPGVVLRVQPGARAPWVARRFEFCQRLYLAGVPMPEPRSVHLVRTPGRSSVVTAWERLDPSGTADWEALGATFAALHHCGLEVPGSLPWEALPARVLDDADKVVATDALTPHTVEMLVSVWQQGRPHLGGPDVVVHADAWPKNVMFASRACLVDWDTVCAAPAVVDLARLVHAARHHNAEVLGPWGPPDLDAFASGYGAELPDPRTADVLVQSHSAAMALRWAATGDLGPWVRATVDRLAAWS